MAENTLAARLLLRYDTYSHWMDSSLILKPGEAAVAIFPAVTSGSVAPVGIKIGNGKNYFDELPWIQAIATDVYNWAKQQTKPSYTASEIIGLDDYISQHSSGGGGSGGAESSSSYRIVYVTSLNKYILQYYDAATDDWINTTSEIDLSTILNRLNTIERWANGARSDLGNIEVPMVEYIYEELVYYLNQINYSDASVPHQFVTSVSQQKGKIAVTRSVITAADIASGVLTTEQGGTGLSYVEEDEVLVGGLNGEIHTYKFVNTIDELDRAPLITAGAVIDYVNTKTAGLTGAMHFIGEATVVIANNSSVDPQITNYNFSRAEPGDVILGGNTQEYVWTGAAWRLLGDEGSYVVKGSITDVDIAENAAINVEKISGLNELLNTKVDKISGKDLSTNDYTDEDQQKLTNIEDYAQANIIEHIFFNDNELTPSIVNSLPKSIDLHFNGMTEDQSAKLAGIENNAQVNIIEYITVDGILQPVNNKTIALTTDPHTEHINVIEHIKLNNIEILPDNSKTINLNILSITENERTKLAGIETFAQVNKVESLIINGTQYTPTNDKTIQITLDQAALNLNVLEGATVPADQNSTEDVPQVAKKLQLARIALTGNIQNLLQTTDTYITLDCGSSTEVI